MRVPLFAVIATSMIALSASAFAANDPTNSQTPQPATTAPQPTAAASSAKNALDPNKVICKTTEVTGSRLGGERTCMTRARWDEVSRANSQAVENAQTQGSYDTAHQPH